MANENQGGPQLTSKNMALQIFDGLMLGDGNLRTRGINASFGIGLSDRKWKRITNQEFLRFLHHIKEIFETLGVEAFSGHPKVFSGFYKSGKPYEQCRLDTKVSSFLASEQRRWYPGRWPDGRWKKDVPSDISLTPISLAYWFMGDGRSERNKGCPTTITITLHTEGYSEFSVLCLETHLHRLGISTGRTHCKVIRGSGTIITIPQVSVDDFMSSIDPYVIEPYRYKVKYRKPTQVCLNNLKKRVVESIYQKANTI
jgi:hypothetical protein